MVSKRDKRSACLHRVDKMVTFNLKQFHYNSLRLLEEHKHLLISMIDTDVTHLKENICVYKDLKGGICIEGFLSDILHLCYVSKSKNCQHNNNVRATMFITILVIWTF